MAKILLFSLLSFLSVLPVHAQSDNDRRAIIQVLGAQTKAWNAGNMEIFMQGYWQSDSLKFIGKNGIVYGWQNTLDRYRKNYPDPASRGTLRFEIISVDVTGRDAAFVVGQFFLTRPEKGNATGYFTLYWRKIKGQWKIVADHTS